MMVVLTQTLQPLRFFAMLFFVVTKNTYALFRIVSRQGFRAGRPVTDSEAQFSFLWYGPTKVGL